MRFVRFWLPGLIVLAGIVLAVSIGSDAAWEGGALLVSAGLSVLLLNVLFRLGVRGDRERLREEQAREEFERTGVWPDDEEPDAQAGDESQPPESGTR
jgi:hypothetical protein